MTPRRGGVVAPSLAAGVLLALSVPPFGVWPSAFVGAALLYWRLRGLRLRARLLAGWVAGLGCFAISLYWSRSFNWYGAVVLVIIESVPMALAGAATPPRHGRVPAYVGAATLAEAVRLSWPFGGLPVGGVFLGQNGGPLLWAARLGGPLLLTASVWAGGAALGELVPLVRRAADGGRPDGPPWGAVTAALFVLAVGVAGWLGPDGGRPLRDVRVAAVQGGGQRGYTALETGRPGDFTAQLAATLPLTRTAPRPDLVVWPEDVIALGEPLRSSPLGPRVAALARALHATLLAGVTITQPGARFLNEIVAWGPDGTIVSVFEKVHRVPFGEYIPDRAFFSHLANLAGVPSDAVAGHGSGLVRTPAGPLGILVSFEVFFADRGRSAVRAGAELLVVPTNTSSYSSRQMPSQEVAAGRVQAVAEGRDLVVVAPTGYSAFVSANGVVRRISALSVRSVLTDTVALRSGTTLYERLGDLPVLVLAALALAGGAAAELAGRRGDDGSSAVSSQRALATAQL
jgi:apolipoprotein N-acyltransferase